MLIWHTERVALPLPLLDSVLAVLTADNQRVKNVLMLQLCNCDKRTFPQQDVVELDALLRLIAVVASVDDTHPMPVEAYKAVFYKYMSVIVRGVERQDMTLADLMPYKVVRRLVVDSVGILCCGGIAQQIALVTDKILDGGTVPYAVYVTVELCCTTCFDTSCVDDKRNGNDKRGDCRIPAFFCQRPAQQQDDEKKEQ